MKVLAARPLDGSRALLLVLRPQRGNTRAGPARHASLWLVEARRGGIIAPEAGESRTVWRSAPFPLAHRRRSLDVLDRALAVAHSLGTPLPAEEARSRLAEPRMDAPLRLEGTLAARVWGEDRDSRARRA